MLRRSLVFVGAAAMGIGLSNANASQAQPSTHPDSATESRAVLDKYCVTCHNENLRTAGLMLDKLNLGQVSEDAQVWETVVRKLRGGVMPPAGRPRPDKATYDAVASWIEGTLDDAAQARPTPGRPSLHRLNRTEYTNAVRDLLALDIDVASLLPPDNSTHGFDNIAAALGVSPALVERYVAAARTISRMAIGDPGIRPITETYRNARDLTQNDHLEGQPFGTRGGMLVRHHFPLDAEYDVKIDLLKDFYQAVRGIREEQDLVVTLDGERVGTFKVGGFEDPVMGPGGYLPTRQDSLGGLSFDTAEADKHLRIRLAVKAGLRTIGVTFPKITSALFEDIRQPFLRSFVAALMDFQGWAHVSAVSISGPYEATGIGDTSSRRRIFTCRPTASREETPCATEILSTLARRAFRRPVTDEDLRMLLTFYEEGRIEGGFEDGIQLALQRILISPDFVFRVERDPEGIAPATTYRISDVELASRLSFFLWSSIPDDELLDLAASGSLSDPAVLEQQVRRMLADSRSQALTANFAGQWLYLRNLTGAHPNPATFPDFDDNLRQGFRRETELLFDNIIRENRSVLDLLNAEYTFVNERLARHYGIPNVYGDHFRRITVTDDNRRGLLGHGSILTVTSYSTRTSPVLRGKWILDNILGMPPPPPPPDVPELEENSAEGKVLSMRERMAHHRTNAVCAGCHSKMDPLGLSLENFDAVGKWRTNDDNGTPIDASGSLADGTSFTGAAGLRRALVAQPGRFFHTVTEKLLTYAVGRGVEYYDQPAVRTITREAARSDYRFSALITAIVKSTPFQMRRSQS